MLVVLSDFRAAGAETLLLQTANIKTAPVVAGPHEGHSGYINGHAGSTTTSDVILEKVREKGNGRSQRYHHAKKSENNNSAAQQSSTPTEEIQRVRQNGSQK